MNLFLNNRTNFLHPFNTVKEFTVTKDDIIHFIYVLEQCGICDDIIQTYIKKWLRTHYIKPIHPLIYATHEHFLNGNGRHYGFHINDKQIIDRSLSYGVNILHPFCGLAQAYKMTKECRYHVVNSIVKRIGRISNRTPCYVHEYIRETKMFRVGAEGYPTVDIDEYSTNVFNREGGYQDHVENVHAIDEEFLISDYELPRSKISTMVKSFWSINNMFLLNAGLNCSNHYYFNIPKRDKYIECFNPFPIDNRIRKYSHCSCSNNPCKKCRYK